MRKTLVATQLKNAKEKRNISEVEDEIETKNI